MHSDSATIVSICNAVTVGAHVTGTLLSLLQSTNALPAV